ncbi:MAG: glycoside hydrolase family 99-like domain-containing protein, partial [Desulfobulbaceae bacterium]|nr:glycoside hydrolase family 99-like domain-containing protein [Desulfobulbaceae bacterium]
MSKYSHQDAVFNDTSSQGIILSWMKDGSEGKRKVLEFGPSSGYMTEMLRDYCNCDVYIVEADHLDFQKAMNFAADGICGDIMKFDWLNRWRDIQFDCVIFADVLEHLYDPAAVLSSAKKILHPDGVALFSVPNIGHDDIVANLFLNRFSYTRTGLLDNTHIRFFAHKNLIEFAGKSGFEIAEEKFIRRHRRATEQYDSTWKEENPFDSILHRRKDGDIYQFVVKLVTIEYAARHAVQYKRQDDLAPVQTRTIKSKWYYDLGEGFSEQLTVEADYPIDAAGETFQSFSVPKGCVALRWDPTETPCIIHGLEITSAKGEILTSSPGNGLAMDGDSVWFHHNDPQYFIALPVASDAEIKLRAYIRPLPGHIAFSKEFARLFDDVCRMREESRQIVARNRQLEADNAVLSSRWGNVVKRALVRKAPTLPPNCQTEMYPPTIATGDSSLTRGKRRAFLDKMYTPNKEFGLFIPYQKHDLAASDVKLIAYYLPQYHSFPENDIWWEKGFTEWTNVTKTLPWYEGHYQPRLPFDVGFYDLGHTEIMRRQVELAKNYGIGGFCFYYYWFNGKRLMEKPMDNFLAAEQELNFPFCICWANENWTRRWDGNEMDTLIEQKHSDTDDLACITDMARYLRCEHYIRINGKPLIMIYRGDLLPDVARTVAIWKEYCLKNGIGDIRVAGCCTRGNQDPVALGFDLGVEFPPHGMGKFTKGENREHEILPDLTYRYHDMANFIDNIDSCVSGDANILKAVFTNWDNAPRRQNFPHMYPLTPEQYNIWLRRAIETTRQAQEPERRLVFINAWNEWAEAAHLEPDQRYGYAWLEATAQAVCGQATKNETSQEMNRGGGGGGDHKRHTHVTNPNARYPRC